MTSKTEQYRAILEKYESTYGEVETSKKPIIFNITGTYRNKLYEQRTWGYYAATAMFLIVAWFASFYLANPLIAVFVAGVQYSLVVSLLFDPEQVFDGEIIDVNGKKFGVLAQSQETEGKMESRNFVQTNDKRKLIDQLRKADIVFNEKEVVTWSIGSTTGQCIDGLTVAPYTEVDMGIETQDDTTIRAFLKAHEKKLSYNGVLVLMNSAGYGIDEKAGIVYSDNKDEYENIRRNIVPRIIGGTGNNDTAMNFIAKFVELHKEGEYNYVLAVVPRGNKSMPQGGSHSKQYVLEHLLNKRNVALIEVSGKQTKKFEYAGDFTEDDREGICKNIKEKKIIDENGKSHGSFQVFARVNEWYDRV
jgi:hypothetical protein